MSLCVRCGDSLEAHKDKDGHVGGNKSQPACGQYLDHWPEGMIGSHQPMPEKPAPAPLPEAPRPARPAPKLIRKDEDKGE